MVTFFDADRTASSSSTAQVSTTADPQWVLLADANVTSLDTTSPTASFGVERGTPFTLARVRLRKNLDSSTVEADAGDRAFARRVLAPSVGDFSLSAHGEWRPIAWIRCDKCDQPDAAIRSKYSIGGYAGVDVGETLFSAKQMDGSTLSTHAVPFSWSGGAVARLEGTMPGDANVLGSKVIVFAPYVGYSGRMLGGDLGSEERLGTIGVDSKYLHGVEAGIGLQLGNILFDPKLTFLSNGKDPDIHGLTGLQFQIGITFVLPWTVVGGDPTDKQQKAKAERDKAEAEREKTQAEAKQQTTEAEKQTLQLKLDKATKELSDFKAPPKP